MSRCTIAASRCSSSIVAISRGASLPPTLAAYYYMFVAQGYRQFDQISLATAAIGRAIDIATANQLGQARFEAEEILDTLKSDQARADREERSALQRTAWTPEVQGIAKALHELRTMAGVNT